MITDNKYLKISSDAKSQDFKVIGDRVMAKELIFSHYSCGDFFYLILK
jgi:hypothetical protein